MEMIHILYRQSTFLRLKDSEIKSVLPQMTKTMKSKIQEKTRTNEKCLHEKVRTRRTFKCLEGKIKQKEMKESGTGQDQQYKR